LIIGVSHPTQTYLVPGTYTVNLYAYNDLGCNATAQATVTVLPEPSTTGINEPGKQDVIVVAEGKVVSVNMNSIVLSGNAQVQVYNLLGQLIKSAPLNTQTTSINLESDANGYYLISIRNAGSVNTKRIFIAK